MITSAYICDAIRTPFCRYGGALSAVRADDLAAIALAALAVRNPGLDWSQAADIVLGCANQAGEDNRNVARMALLLAGLPVQVPGSTVNRLGASGMEAVAVAARAIRSGEAFLAVAGGVESMSRAPFTLAKAPTPFAREAALAESNAGGFLNPWLQAGFGADAPAWAAANVAREFGIERAARDRFAQASLAKARAARDAGATATELTPVTIARRNGDPAIVEEDEGPVCASAAAAGSVAGEERLPGGPGAIADDTGAAAAPGDGACALLLACDKAALQYSLMPRARVLATASAGVPPRIGGMGAASAARLALVQARLALEQIDLIELDETFAATALAVLRDWRLLDDDPRVNPDGGALALCHPLGATGARLVAGAVARLHRIKGRYALCALEAGGGQGMAMVLERV